MTDFLVELEGLRALDPQTLSTVHNRYFPEVFRYARYRVGDQAAAEDIASEVFLRLLEALDAGRGPKSSLRGWLFGTAAHLIDDHFRHRYRRQTETLSEELTADGPDPARHAEQRESLEAVRAAAAQLTPEQHHVIALRFGSALSLKETAEVMDKDPNAVKALQFRALRALRRNLGEGRP